MARKLLVSRLGAGTITVAFCAALPGCNLAIQPSDPLCIGVPSSRGMSTVTCPDGAADAPSDTARDAPSDTTRDPADAPVGETGP
jgi:hypothetical protein